MLRLSFVSALRSQKPGICLTLAAYALEDSRIMSGIGQCFACHSMFGIEAPPERVFPLLCPVREHEWIPTWKAEMVHSKSGVAELDCVFRTNSSLEGNRTWICTNYAPPRTIGYTSFSDLGYIMRLDIRLEARGENATHVSWSRRFIATNPTGEAWVKQLDTASASKATERLATLLGHFLTTGSMLRA